MNSEKVLNSHFYENHKKISGCERREIECGLVGDYWRWIISGD